MVQQVKKERQTNLELYRIIVMLLIVAHHSVVNSGVLQEFQVDNLGVRSLFYAFLGMWGKTGINCFVLITGYFMCTSQITTRKFLKLFLQIEFYNIIIYFVFVSFGFKHYTTLKAIGLLFPIHEVSHDFVGCFLLFYLFIPFLNKLIHQLDKRNHLLLIILCLFIYTFYGTLNSVICNYVTWFIVLYFISSYLRLYQPFINFSRKKLGGVMALNLILSMLSVAFIIWYNGTPYARIVYFPYRFVQDSNTFLAVATSISAFLYFKDMKIKQNHFINTVASTTFGVLLIHANSDAMRQWLWMDTFHCKEHYYDKHYMIYAIGIVLLTFICCSIIDYLRICFVEKYTFKYIDTFLMKHHIR